MLVTRYVTRLSQRESQTPTRTDPNLTGPTASFVAEFTSWRSVSDARGRNAMMALTREVSA